MQALYGCRERPAGGPQRHRAEPPAGPTGALRARLGIGDAPLVLHQGAPAPDRGCEQLIEAMAELPGRPPRLPRLVAVPRLRGRAAARAGRARRARALPPVACRSSELLAHTADADVGVSLLQDTCENHRLALPNKVFEYVAAGVPVVVSDLPELARGSWPSTASAGPRRRPIPPRSPSACGRRSRARRRRRTACARAADGVELGARSGGGCSASTTGSPTRRAARSCSCATR